MTLVLHTCEITLVRFTAAVNYNLISFYYSNICVVTLLKKLFFFHLFCSAVNCPPLTHIPNLSYDSSWKAMYGGVFSLQCAKGFIFNDTTKVKSPKCLATGEWNTTFSNDTCQGIQNSFLLNRLNYH